MAIHGFLVCSDPPLFVGMSIVCFLVLSFHFHFHFPSTLVHSQLCPLRPLPALTLVTSANAVAIIIIVIIININNSTNIISNIIPILLVRVTHLLMVTSANAETRVGPFAKWIGGRVNRISQTYLLKKVEKRPKTRNDTNLGQIDHAEVKILKKGSRKV